MKIAILEDNPGMVRMLQATLENAGYEVHAFQEVKAFLDFFTEHEDVDILITDFRLMTERAKANLSGADVIRLVRTISPNMPAILISAAPMFVLESATNDIIAVYIMQKPFKMSLLLETIQVLST